MATQSWLSDWGLNIDQPAAWALLLLVVVVIAIILIWRHKRRPALNDSISVSANDERDLDALFPWPDEQASPPPFADDSIASHDATPKVGEAAVNDRAIGWRPLYPYIKHRRFTKWT